MIWIPKKRDLIVPKRFKRAEPPQRGRCDLSGIVNPYFSAAPFTYDAADFDGTNDYLKRTSAFTGIASSKTGILSVWVQRRTATIQREIFYGEDSTHHTVVDLSQGSANPATYAFSGDGGLGTTRLLLTSSTHASSAWFHFLSSWDLSTAGGTNLRRLYINDVDETTAVTFTNNNIDWAVADKYNISGQFDGATNSNLWDGGIAEFYWAPGQFLDFTNSANRRLFISATGHPVSLGADGSTPTGTKPTVYLHIDQGETANNFALNRAGNGDFTVVGALTTFASRP